MAARANVVVYDRLLAVVLCVLATCSSPTTQAYDPFTTPSIVSGSRVLISDRLHDATVTGR